MVEEVDSVKHFNETQPVNIANIILTVAWCSPNTRMLSIAAEVDIDRLEEESLEPIDAEHVQSILSSYANTPVYLHVETTNGAYANHFDQRVFNAGAFLRNIQLSFEHAQLKGGHKDPFRVGLKLKENGWVYVQGLTHYEINEDGEFLIAGFNYEGQLAATLEISKHPFKA